MFFFAFGLLGCDVGGDAASEKSITAQGVNMIDDATCGKQYLGSGKLTQTEGLAENVISEATLLASADVSIVDGLLEGTLTVYQMTGDGAGYDRIVMHPAIGGTETSDGVFEGNLWDPEAQKSDDSKFTAKVQADGSIVMAFDGRYNVRCPCTFGGEITLNAEKWTLKIWTTR